jgi:glucose/mannose transport system substrate-binding protein
MMRVRLAEGVADELSLRKEERMLTRRDFLRISGGSLAGAYAMMLGVACGGGGSQQANELEVFSWWTSGGEAAALDELFKAFKERYPNVKVTNAAIAGGGGSAAKSVLQNRLAGGDPPSTWQTHSSAELSGQYVSAGYVEPITDLYEQEGLLDVIRPPTRESLTVDGEIYAVLTGVHRGNGFWYSNKVLEQNGLEVGDTLSLDQFFQMADQLKKAGVTALAVGDKDIFASAEVLENTLVGVIGPEKYTALFNGEESFQDPEVKQGMEMYGRMLEYQNSNHSALTWDQAVKMVIDGQAAFNSMGDWAYGEFAKAGAKAGTDFGWVSHPGTDGTFVMVDDGFVLPKNTATPDLTRNWLKVIATPEAQIAFNRKKGSSPWRTDIDKSKFGPYQQWAISSFTSDSLVPSVTHALAAPAGFVQSYYDAVTRFVQNRDVNGFAESLSQAAENANLGG